MGSVLTQYFKILITTVPFLGPGRDGLSEGVQKYNRAVNNNIQNQWSHQGHTLRSATPELEYI